MAINYQTLRFEINSDPLGLGYPRFVSLGDDSSLADFMNTPGTCTPGFVITIPEFPTGPAFDLVDQNEFETLTISQQNRLMAAASGGTFSLLDPLGNPTPFYQWLVAKFPPPAIPPSGLALSYSNFGGVLTSGLYTYRVTSVTPGVVESLPSSEVSITIPPGSGNSCSITLMWNWTPGAKNYNVYGRTAGQEKQLINSNQAWRWVDGGTAIPTGNYPTLAPNPNGTKSGLYLAQFSQRPGSRAEELFGFGTTLGHLDIAKALRG